jgi:hypothetical protein
MNDQKKCLPDGQYACAATLHVKEGKVVVVLHSTFGLEPGATMPLLRREHDLRVESLSGSQVGILNGHTII